MLGQSLMRHTDNLSKGLQHQDLSESEGQSMAMLTIDTLKTLRNEKAFNQFFDDDKPKGRIWMSMNHRCQENKKFDQPGLKVLRNVEDLIVRAASYSYQHYSGEFLFVTEFYSDDVNKDMLKVQLETLKTRFSKQHKKVNDQIPLSRVLDYMRKLPLTLRVIYADVAALIRILLTMPANCKCHKQEDVLCASEN
ncbi:hypothetical protein DPMN_095991 [Dreissena polymorpha]|uniref:Uncharacterized protein n=1 Tax=Dreissena polymorpha TaxID=45954 RepID=A0A9D4LAD3_DREPO|nr:hypothetical protein DPMN_095991 [Dreissena polymorpha]